MAAFWKPKWKGFWMRGKSFLEQPHQRHPWERKLSIFNSHVNFISFELGSYQTSKLTSLKISRKYPVGVIGLTSVYSFSRLIFNFYFFVNASRLNYDATLCYAVFVMLYFVGSCLSGSQQNEIRPSLLGCGSIVVKSYFAARLPIVAV